VPVFSCGRSLYTDWRMVVMVGGKCPTPCEKGGGCPVGERPEGNMSEGGNVQDTPDRVADGRDPR